MKPDTHIIYERLHAFDDVLQAVSVQREVASTTSAAVQQSGMASTFVRGAFVAVLSVAVASAGLMGSTHAYFNDLERSTNNFFRAGVVRFTATSDVLEGNVGVGAPLALPILVEPDPESIPLQYRVSAETDSESAFCTAILADSTAPVVYSGAVAGVAGLSTATGTWPFALSMQTEEGIAPEDICVVTFIYTAWDASKPVQSGFTDTRQLSVTLHPLLTEEITVQSFMATEPAPEDVSETPPAEVVVEVPPVPEPTPEPEPEPIPEPTPEPPAPEVTE